MKTVILVPFQPQNQYAEKVWMRVGEHLLSYGYPIYVAPSKYEQWNRSSAINAASEKAGDWDVAVIADADTIHWRDVRLVEAVESVAETEFAEVPWRDRWKLSKDVTHSLIAHNSIINLIGMENFIDKEDGYAHNNALAEYPAWRVGSTIVVHRAIWNVTAGFDERFVGWGYEDCAFRVAIEKIRGETIPRREGTILHLWHPLEHGNPWRNRNRFMKYYNATKEQLQHIRGNI